jgi:hypothetical protein
MQLYLNVLLGQNYNNSLSLWLYWAVLNLDTLAYLQPVSDNWR